MAHPLRFREDGSFTIVQFTDIHWKDGSAPDLRSRAVMDTVLEAERPDLVVFTGDTIYNGYNAPGEAVCRDPLQALKDAVDAVESRAVPWAYIFGNHDTESLISREELMEAVLAMKHTVTAAPPEPELGVGNYKLEVAGRDGTPETALFFFDAGVHSPLPSVDGYCWISREQIGWYVRSSRELPGRQGGEGPIPALAFLHIPLPEYKEVWESRTCYGNKFEDVCCPKVNSGLFAAMLEQGNVMGTFAGHDHVNDYWGELHGIRLCYGRATGHHTYGRDGFLRGARIIRLRQGERSFETWLRLEDGSVIREQPEHQPERR